MSVKWRIYYYDEGMILKTSDNNDDAPDAAPKLGVMMICQNTPPEGHLTHVYGESRYQWLVEQEYWVPTDEQGMGDRARLGVETGAIIRGLAVSPEEWRIASGAALSDQDFGGAGLTKEEVTELLTSNDVQSLEELFSAERFASELGYYNKAEIRELGDTNRKRLLAAGRIAP